MLSLITFALSHRVGAARKRGKKFLYTYRA
jgi:hypothetical protein